MKQLAIVTVASVVVALSGCQGSKEDQLVDAKRDRRAIVDALYTEYGGGALASEMKKDTDDAATKIAADPQTDGKQSALELMKLVGNAASEVDRAAFEVQCTQLGSGDRPVVLNDKAKAFFAQGSVEKKCAEVAKLERTIERLEREIAPR
jgi:hypothetical protein